VAGENVGVLKAGQRKVPTGILGLDTQLEGGLPAGSTILLLAEPTNAPYRFCEQFAGAGLDAGEPVYYYSLDRPRDDTIDKIIQFSVGNKLGAGLKYVDCYSQKLRSLDESVLDQIGIQNHSPIIPQHIIPALLESGRERPFRIVLESLSEAIEIYGEEVAMKMLNQICAIVRRLNAVAVLIMVKGLHSADVEMRARQLVDGVLEFGVQRQGFGLYTFLSITKMRGLTDEIRLFMYRDTEKGLWLESTRRVM
jgi:archaeal flagellar protein FlaH